MAELNARNDSFISMLMQVSGRARPRDIHGMSEVEALELLRAYMAAHPEQPLAMADDVLVYAPTPVPAAPEVPPAVPVETPVPMPEPEPVTPSPAPVELPVPEFAPQPPAPEFPAAPVPEPVPFAPEPLPVEPAEPLIIPGGPVDGASASVDSAAELPSWYYEEAVLPPQPGEQSATPSAAPDAPAEPMSAYGVPQTAEPMSAYGVPQTAEPMSAYAVPETAEPMSAYAVPDQPVFVPPAMVDAPLDSSVLGFDPGAPVAFASSETSPAPTPADFAGVATAEAAIPSPAPVPADFAMPAQPPSVAEPLAPADFADVPAPEAGVDSGWADSEAFASVEQVVATEMAPAEEPPISALWWLAVLFFGFPGALVAWLVNRSHSPKRSKPFLIVGIVLAVITVLAFAGIFALAAVGVTAGS